jgi:DNA-binding NtrC family response regulator
MTERTVLLVEDEVLLCWILEEALFESGYRVETRTTGDEGLEAIESQRSFDALVTNIRLAEGPDGWALARHARERDPTIPVIYISGDSTARHGDEGVAGSLMLAKPFEPEALRHALGTLLAD